MVIEPAGALPDVLKMARHSDVKVLFWENQPLPVNLRQVVTRGQAAKNIFAILGPEGGFSPAEVEAASQEGFITADLGPRILRAETATIAAAVLLQFMFGDLGKNT
jgi:16S rRNA (uracil1498-N3)-methyltransferase